MIIINAATLQKFSLNPEEQKICTTLLAANSLYGLNTTFRIAGGFVRDRLLGIESDDLDIALDNLTGRQLYQYLAQMGEAYGIGKSYTVDANVEKSKHLETVAVEIYGRKIDFVNLRSESYGDSRVPTMEMGTPQIDAERRDLTINALFFNINTGQVEDYVGGMKDLQAMVLRTPLDPKKTFMDDPLRMLRVIRFFSRYPEATIDPSLIQTMSLPEVQQAYMSKVSSERAGPEIIKMLSGAKPADALEVLFSTGMDKAAFNVPEMQGIDLRMDQRNKHHRYTLLDHTLRVVRNLHQLLVKDNVPKDLRVKMLLAALFHDYGKAYPGVGRPKAKDPTQYSYIGHEDKSVELAESIMKSISIPDNDRRFVAKVISLHMKPHLYDWNPKQIGRFMRDSQIPGQDSDDVWRFVMLHSIADQMSSDETNPENVRGVEQKWRDIEKINSFKARPGPSLQKSILDGNVIKNFFPMLKQESGFIREVQQMLLDAQAEGTVVDAPSAIQYVKSIENAINQKYRNGNPEFKKPNGNAQG
jgi:tRNA nucleotidyltransferase/poly(A) polymerase